MINTKEEYKYYKIHLRATIDSSFTANLLETIEALIKVARAVKRAEQVTPGYLTSNIMNAVEDLPDWITEDGNKP